MTKNILFFSIDNLRFDCVGFQPDQSELEEHDALRFLQTPTLDAIAEKSLCFTQCISTNTYTTAAHASILTGLIPPRHGVRPFFDTTLNPEAATLAEILKENGYRTILYTDTSWLFKQYIGLDRGFDLCETSDDAGLLGLLDDLREEKVFLFVHMYDVHEPFMHNTNNYRQGSNDDYLQEMQALYDYCGFAGNFAAGSSTGEIWNRLVRTGPLSDRRLDALLPLYVKGVSKFDSGRFAVFIDGLDQLGFLDDCLEVVFSDHGEGKCSQNNRSYFGHAGELFDDVIRVPLMISHPDLKPGESGSLTSVVDIAPTALSLLGIGSGAADFNGTNCLSETRGSCYAENWISIDQLENNLIDEQTLATEVPVLPECALSQMALRTDKSKLVVWYRGDAQALLDSSGGLSNKQFIKALYRELLGWPDAAAGIEQYLNPLDDGSLTRKELVDRFLGLEQYKSRVPFRYDLRSDPGEENPLTELDAADLPMVELIHEINSQAVSTEKIFRRKTAAADKPDQANFPDELTVRRMLKDLGYF